MVSESDSVSFVTIVGSKHKSPQLLQLSALWDKFMAIKKSSKGCNLVVQDSASIKFSNLAWLAFGSLSNDHVTGKANYTQVHEKD